MARYGLACVLLVSFSWGQTSSQSTSANPKTAVPATAGLQIGADPSRSSKANASIDRPGTAVITIDGLCPDRPARKTPGSDCRTVITQSEFEMLVSAVQPGMPAHAKRGFALEYAEALIASSRAEEMGLDKSASYAKLMNLARIQILFKELQKAIQEQASHVSDREIEDYYANNSARFEKADLDRIHIPRVLRQAGRDQKLIEPPQTTELAGKLHDRAVTGEAFPELQKEAYRLAGMPEARPQATITVRRTSLAPNQVSVMDLKPGQVSAVLEDPSGYVIYKMKSKTTAPLAQAREEIMATLRLQHVREAMDTIEESATTALNEGYFRRGPSPAVDNNTQQSGPKTSVRKSQEMR